MTSRLLKGTLGTKGLAYLTLMATGLFISNSCKQPATPITETKNEIKATMNLNFQKAKVFVTAKETDYRLSEIKEVSFEEFEQPEEHFPTIMVDPKKTFQVIEGIGGAITDASAETFYKMPKDKQDEILTAYFDKEKGIGYSLCRTHINSCDF
jgi:glucosylceramidase